MGTFRQGAAYTASIAVLLSSATAWAQAGDEQNQIVTRGDAPDWIASVEPLSVPDDASGLLFVRLNQSEVHFTADEQYLHTNMLVRLLHPSALQIGNVGLVWNPETGAPVVHAVRIHRDGEVIDVLEQTEFTVLRREDQLEAATLDGLLTANLQVPDLRVGDDLEIAHTLVTTDPTLAETDFGTMFLSQEEVQGRVLLRMSWETEADRPTFRMDDDLERWVTRDGTALSIQADNPPALVVPRDAPGRYSWRRIIEYTDFADWDQISRQFHPMYVDGARLAPDSPVREEAARIMRAHDGDMDRARAALDLVTQQVRYVFVGLNSGGYTPASAEETWQRRYGDCKGKTVLLLALLAEMGIEAEAVLAANSLTDDGMADRLPSPAYFDHVLVRAEIDGEQFWMDGTMPPATVPTRRPVLPYRHVLPLRGNGAELETLPREMLAYPGEVTLYEIDARAGFNVPARLVTTTILRGPEALGQYAAFSAVTDSQLEAGLRNQIAGSSGWDSVDDVEWRFDRDRQASILTITGTGMPDWENEGGGAYDLSLPGGGFNPPGRHQRPADQDGDAPYWNDNSWTCSVTTVRIPEGTKAEDWAANSTFGSLYFGRFYRRMFGFEDGAIRMIRSLRTEDQEVSAERAARDNARLDAFDNSRARIWYEPGANTRWTRRVSDAQVPATFEGDWVAAPLACDPDWGAD